VAAFVFSLALVCSVAMSLSGIKTVGSTARAYYRTDPVTFWSVRHWGAVSGVKLLPLPQPPLRARTDARTNPSAQRAAQLRSVLARVYAVARQYQIATTVP
jgi:hypothetical protein